MQGTSFKGKNGVNGEYEGAKQPFQDISNHTWGKDVRHDSDNLMDNTFHLVSMSIYYFLPDDMKLIPLDYTWIPLGFQISDSFPRA